MYFDFEDGHPDLERVPSAFTPREGAMASVIVHLSALLLVLLYGCRAPASGPKKRPRRQG
jgi:hypothetical protein